MNAPDRQFFPTGGGGAGWSTDMALDAQHAAADLRAAESYRDAVRDQVRAGHQTFDALGDAEAEVERLARMVEADRAAWDRAAGGRL